MLCQSEKAYIHCQNQQRQQLREVFVAAQKNFDKSYRRAKRKYEKDKIIEIENFSQFNAKEFWQNIKKLGPQKSSEIPLSVYNEDGNLVNDLEFVMNKWTKDYECLYNFTAQEGQFDDIFYHSCNESDINQENLYEQLDSQITEREVKRVIQNAKTNKSIGLDNLPNEIFKENSSYRMLTALFNKVYENNLVPSIWNTSIVKPIPKSSLNDPHIPLQYRGISLLSTVYKLFTSILNKRIQNVAEEILNDTQNGFRSKRSCEDHIYSLTSIIRNRKRDKQDTFIIFVDFEKAFDRVDRNLLFHQMGDLGFGGKMLSILYSLYKNCYVRLNLNGLLTPMFNSNVGVKQGDSLSATLFNLYIDDLADVLNCSNKGVILNDELNIAALMYADDLAIIAESEENMQSLLEILEKWCYTWRMIVNVNKTKIVHFRSQARPRSNFVFKLNGYTVEYAERYKYLGIVLDEHLLYNVTASVLSDSGNRALAAIYTKFSKLKGLGFSTYSKLYHTGVVPILDYCSGIWGFQKFGYLDSVQNKAIRFFLGIHRFAPNLAINGDVGWESSTTRRRIQMIRYWNRLISMDMERVTKKIFIWDMQNRKSKGSWNSDIYKLFTQIGKLENYRNQDIVDVEEARQILVQQEKNEWLNNIQSVSKLVNYKKFKEEFGTEAYIYKIQNRYHRSIFAQLRCGILPLKVETGRYTNIPKEFRLCIFCDKNVIEDEMHFLFDCSLYDEIRKEYWGKFKNILQSFELLTSEDKFSKFMSGDFVKLSSEYVSMCYNLRQTKLYI